MSASALEAATLHELEEGAAPRSSPHSILTRLILEHGADVNLRCSRRSVCVLHWTGCGGNVDAVEVLLATETDSWGGEGT